MLRMMKILFWSLWVWDLPYFILLYSDNVRLKGHFHSAVLFFPLVNSTIFILLSTASMAVAVVIYIKASPLMFAFACNSSPEILVIYPAGESERL